MITLKDGREVSSYTYCLLIRLYRVGITKVSIYEDACEPAQINICAERSIEKLIGEYDLTELFSDTDN